MKIKMMRGESGVFPDGGTYFFPAGSELSAPEHVPQALADAWVASGQAVVERPTRPNRPGSDKARDVREPQDNQQAEE